MNRQFHYDLTAATMLEALLAGGFPVKEAASTALVVARSDEMVDWATPNRIYAETAFRPLPMATQVDPRNPVTREMLLSSDHLYPLMQRGDRWHFDRANGWPVITVGRYAAETDELVGSRDRCMNLGAHIHVAQDTDGPHAGYKGWPCAPNLNLSEERRKERGHKLPWYSRVARAFHMDDEAAWGHASDPDADEIQNCRVGAVDTTHRLYVTVSGCVVAFTGRPSGGELEYVNDDSELRTRVECLVAVANARNDADLESRCRRYWQMTTGEPMPDFEPFSGQDLRTWWQVVA